MDALPTWLYILTIIIGGLGGIAGVVSAMTANRTITAQRDKLEAEAVKIRAEAKQIEADIVTKAYSRAQAAALEIIEEYRQEAKRQEGKHKRATEEQEILYKRDVRELNNQYRRLQGLVVEQQAEINELRKEVERLTAEVSRWKAEAQRLGAKLPGAADD